MRLVASDNELQMVAAMQAARTAPGNQLAGQWAGSSSAAPDIGALIAQAMPTGGGSGSSAAAPMPMSRPRAGAGAFDVPTEDEDGFDWGSAGSGALRYGASGAAIGTKILPGWGTAIGGAIGAIAGGIAGGYE